MTEEASKVFDDYILYKEHVGGDWLLQFGSIKPKGVDGFQELFDLGIFIGEWHINAVGYLQVNVRMATAREIVNDSL